MRDNHTLKEVTELLKISRSTLFNRLDKFGLYLEENKHVTMEKGKKFIDSVGVEVIKKNSVHSPDVLNTSEKTLDERDRVIEMLKKDIENLNIQLELYKSNIQDKSARISNLDNEVNNKNNQINELIETVRESRESVKEAHKLNENNQMLLRESQQSILMLESKEQKESGFWKKLFKN